MRKSGRIGFAVPASRLRNDILVPRYYDPSIQDDLESLGKTHRLLPLEALIASGDVKLTQGKYVGKHHYGSGGIPYIRTSDLANWELKASPKHGVSQAVYDEFARRQDVAAGDILLVHEGTYLIGTAALVTPFDLPLLFQHHLAKLRVSQRSELNPYLLLALLGMPIVKRQIRARQFTADTIDSIVGRLQEVVLPVPRDPEVVAAISADVEQAVLARAEGRARLVKGSQRLSQFLRGELGVEWSEFDVDPRENVELQQLLSRPQPFVGFSIASGDVRSDVLIPKYYSPGERASLSELQNCELVTIQQLVDDGIVAFETGDEVGKLNYGTGPMPFVRTSDLGNWELRTDVKQRVSHQVYEAYAGQQSLASEDLLVVRDGTYLVGSVTMLQDEDLPALYCGGINRLRVGSNERIDPYLLFALLNIDVVQHQIRNRQFTRDVIDTVGHRLREVVIPVPSSAAVRAAAANVFERIVRARVAAREALRRVGARIEDGYR